MYAMMCDEETKYKKDQSGMLIIGTFLGWINLFWLMYYMYKELKEEENKFKDL